jgi:hypothetical protein
MSSSTAGLLRPPPRTVPLNLRCALYSNAGVLAGGLILSAGLHLSILFLSPDHLFDGMRLWFGSREARGTFVSFEPAFGGGQASDRSAGGSWRQRQFDENGRIYRVAYMFDLPDGRVMRGESFVRGRRTAERFSKAAPGTNRFVAIEFAPSAPHISRIRNTRTSPLGSGVLFLLAVPAVGLLIAAGGAVRGRRTIRLLRHGAAATATIRKCRFATQAGRLPAPGPNGWRTYERFRDELRRTISDAIDEHGGAFRVRRRPAGGSLESVSPGEFKRGFTSHLRLFRGALYSLFAYWVAVLIAVLWTTWPAADAALFERVAFGAAGLLLAALFGTFGLFALRFLRKASGAITGELKLKGLAIRAECLFEFSTSDRHTVEAKGPVPVAGSALADGPELTAVYDPDDPKRSQLLGGLPVPVRVGPEGELEAWGTSWRIARLVGVALMFATAVCAGLAASGCAADFS